MSVVGNFVGVFCSRIVPAVVFSLVVFIGWLGTTPIPEGTFFATFFPVIRGKLPPTIFGHGRMDGTIPVPNDMKPESRPSNEKFLKLPGGYKMPQNGLGMCCRPSAYDNELVRRTVLWYLLQGGRSIDGAHLYLNHKAIGEGIREAVNRGVPRSEIFVTTKISARHYGYNYTMETVPTYLDELGLEYIDLVLMHFPATFPGVRNDCTRRSLSATECREETWRALSELRKQGIIRNAGVSNFAVHHLKEFEELNGGVLAPVAVNQIQYNPWAPDWMVETFEYCQKRGIAVTAYASLAGSLQNSLATTAQTLMGLAEKHSKTAAQILLRWAIQSNAAIIPGTGNPKHMKENLAVYSFRLSEEDMGAIDRLRSDELAKKFFFMEFPVD